MDCFITVERNLADKNSFKVWTESLHSKTEKRIPNTSHISLLKAKETKHSKRNTWNS